MTLVPLRLLECCCAVSLADKIYTLHCSTLLSIGLCANLNFDIRLIIYNINRAILDANWVIDTATMIDSNLNKTLEDVI